MCSMWVQCNMEEYSLVAYSMLFVQLTSARGVVHCSMSCRVLLLCVVFYVLCCCVLCCVVCTVSQCKGSGSFLHIFTCVVVVCCFVVFYCVVVCCHVLLYDVCCNVCTVVQCKGSGSLFHAAASRPSLSLSADGVQLNVVKYNALDYCTTCTWVAVECCQCCQCQVHCTGLLSLCRWSAVECCQVVLQRIVVTLPPSWMLYGIVQWILAQQWSVQ